MSKEFEDFLNSIQYKYIASNLNIFYRYDSEKIEAAKTALMIDTLIGSKIKHMDQEIQRLGQLHEIMKKGFGHAKKERKKQINKLENKNKQMKIKRKNMKTKIKAKRKQMKEQTKIMRMLGKEESTDS